MASASDLLRVLDEVLISFARKRLERLLAATAPPAPALQAAGRPLLAAPAPATPAKPASPPPTREAKAAKAAWAPLPCPAKLPGGRRCGKPGVKGPRFQFHCTAHQSHGVKRRQADYRSFKAEQAGKVQQPVAKPVPMKAMPGKQPAPAKPSAPAQKPAGSAKLDAKTRARNEAKRIAGTKPVACPVPGCGKPGVRTFANFCIDHNRALGKAEKKKLRAAQVAMAQAKPAATATPAKT